ncbi:MAG: hypothetical protein ACT4PL_13425, partial [Phycisphaerales bacterium]
MHVSRFICLLPTLFAALSFAQSPRVIEDGSTSSAWRVITAEGVTLSHEPATDELGRACVRVRFAFITGGGYGILQRDIGIDLPENYEFIFDVKAPPGTPRNNLELKLLDDAGENVWWVNRRNFEFPEGWTTLRSRRRHFEFAWGPSGGAALSRAAKMEIVVASASGGAGEFLIDDVQFRALEPTRPLPAAPARVEDASGVTLDLGGSGEFDGAVISLKSREGAGAGEIVVSVSDDGVTYRPLGRAPAPATVAGSTAGMTVAHTPDAQGRFVRFASADPQETFLPGATIELLPGGSVADGSALVTLLAGRAPRGLYPRWALREQTYWTVLGLPERAEESLLSEDGALEVRTRGYSIEPFVVTSEGTLSWSNGTVEHELAGGVHPVATVRRLANGLRLAVTAGAAEVSGKPVAVAEYRLSNTGVVPTRGELVIAVRPFQVNPPWQALNI